MTFCIKYAFLHYLDIATSHEQEMGGEGDPPVNSKEANESLQRNMPLFGVK